MKLTRTHEQQMAWIDTNGAAAVAFVFLFAAGMFGGTGYFVGVRGAGDPSGWVGVWIAAVLLVAAVITTVIAVRYYRASRPTPPDPHKEALRLGRELLRNKQCRNSRESLEWAKTFDRLKHETNPNRRQRLQLPATWSTEREPKPIYREIIGADGEVTVLRSWGGQVPAPGAKMPPKQKAGTQPVPPYRHDDL